MEDNVQNEFALLSNMVNATGEVLSDLYKKYNGRYVVVIKPFARIQTGEYRQIENIRITSEYDWHGEKVWNEIFLSTTSNDKDPNIIRRSVTTHAHNLRLMPEGFDPRW